MLHTHWSSWRALLPRSLTHWRHPGQGDLQLPRQSHDCVGLSFAPKDFDRLAAIFVERYGPPTQRVANILHWSGETTRVILSRYLGNDVTTGYASVTTKAEMQESERLRDEETKGAGELLARQAG
jgi:hypothetical protein